MNKKVLLENKNFRLLCLVTLISSIGDSLYNLACTLTLYALTGSVSGIAGMWLIRALIRIPAQFVSGVITDKYNRKNISVLVYILSAFLVLLFLFTNNKSIAFAYCLIFVLQGTSDVDNTAQSAMLPEIVKKEDLASANSVFSVLGTVISLVGPGLGGILYKLFGSNILYIVDSITFIIAAFLMCLVKYSYVKNEDSEGHKFLLFVYAKEGYYRIKEKSILKLVLLVMMGCSILGRFYEIYKIYIVNKVIGLQAEDIVLLSYAMAIGSIIAPLLVSHYKEKINNINVFITMGIFALLSYIFWGNSTGIIVCFIANVLIGVFSCFLTITFNTIYQSEVDKQYMGRTMAFYKICTVLSATVGIVLAPVLLEWIGVSLAITSVSIIVILIIVFMKYKVNRLKNI